MHHESCRQVVSGSIFLRGGVSASIWRFSCWAPLPAKQGGVEGAAGKQSPPTATLLNFLGLLDNWCLQDLLDHPNIHDPPWLQNLVDLQNIQDHLDLRYSNDLLDLLNLYNPTLQTSRPPWPSESPGPFRRPGHGESLLIALLLLQLISIVA